MKPFDVVMFSALICVMCEEIYDWGRLQVEVCFHNSSMAGVFGYELSRRISE